MPLEEIQSELKINTDELLKLIEEGNELEEKVKKILAEELK